MKPYSLARVKPNASHSLARHNPEARGRAKGKARGEGEGEPSDLMFSIETIDFGTILINTDEVRTFDVTNTGAQTIVAQMVTTPPFHIESEVVLTLDPDETATVTVRFHPLLDGLQTSEVIFTGGGGGSVVLIGTGTVGGEGEGEGEGVLSVNPPAIAFGEIAIGTSMDQTFTVTNNTEETVTGSATTSAPFAIIGIADYTLAPGAFATITVRFSPTLTGAATGSIVLSGGGGATVNVSGAGGTSEGCSLQSVTLASISNNAMIFIPSNADMVSLSLIAEPLCDEDTANIEFLVDGVLVGNVQSRPYTFLATLGVGQHTVLARATSVSTSGGGPLTVETTATFTVAVAAGADLDGNGVPDDPFATLAMPGDIWAATITSSDTGMDRAIVARAFAGAPANGNIELQVVSATDPGAAVLVSVPQGVIAATDMAIVLVQTAPDLATLLGDSRDTDDLANDVPGPTVPGGEFVDISIVTTTDGGATFSEIDPALLATRPIQITFTGIDPLRRSRGKSLRRIAPHNRCRFNFRI